MAPTSADTLPSSPGSAPTSPPARAEYHDGYVSIAYDTRVWREEIVDTAGQPAMPGINLPGLVHHSLRGCAITFRRGGWEGSEGWRRETEEIVIGEVPYKVWNLLSPEGKLTYVAYLPYDMSTGEEILPVGFDFYVLLGEDSGQCLLDVEEVLATFEKGTGPRGRIVK